MRDSVPSARYSSVCNVLRLWSISLIPTYRVYRLYDNWLSFSVFMIRLHLQNVSAFFLSSKTRKCGGICRGHLRTLFSVPLRREKWFCVIDAIEPAPVEVVPLERPENNALTVY